MIRSVENHRRWHNDVWIWNQVFLLDRTFWYVDAIKDQLFLCWLMVLLLRLLVFLVSNKARLFGGLIPNCKFLIDSASIVSLPVRKIEVPSFHMIRPWSFQTMILAAIMFSAWRHRRILCPFSPQK